mgnify:FL=1
MYINLFDSHVHSDNSPEGRDLVTALCSAAVDKGISGICITDACDMEEFEEQKYGKRLMYSCFAAHKAQDIFSQQLIVTNGVEMCQPLADPDRAVQVIGENRFDFVLGSLHKTRKYGDMMMLNYAHPALDLQDVFRSYYEELLEVVQWGHFDSLAHLTYPLRYFEGQHGVQVDLSRFSGLIDAILSEVIIRGRSLEVNSSGWRQGMGGPLPGRELLERYRKLGGWRITIGSDAHRTADLAADFVQTRRLLQELGFAGACHYRAREPIFLPFSAEILPRVI